MDENNCTNDSYSTSVNAHGCQNDDNGTSGKSSECEDLDEGVEGTEDGVHCLSEYGEDNNNTSAVECCDMNCHPVAFTVDFGVKKDPAKDNLQNAFLVFQKRKQKEIKITKRRKEVPEEVRKRAMSDPEKMWKLRMKFIAQAKKYFGVPYAQKYWTPEDPEYNSPLFLDCCGLLRKILRDMKEDFGFRIGPWNQSYMYDTLPITIDNEEDMKPGDLVFVSATYHNPTMKKQKHNLTHVEIWLGEDTKTIGSRWHKGKVQIFDSYKFNATSYHSPTYIFKSIDTWLMGICRSHCKTHTWRLRPEIFTPTMKSVFAIKADQTKDVNCESPADSDEDCDKIATFPEPDGPSTFLPNMVETSLHITHSINVNST